MNLLLAPFKILSRLVTLALLLIILALVFHNFTAKWLLIFGLSSTLDAPVKIGRVKIGWADTDVRFGDLEIGNARGSGTGTLAKIPELYIDFEVSSLWEGRLHLDDLALNVAELHIMRLPDGRVNLFGLKPMRQGPSQEGSAGRPRTGGQPSVIKYQIDRLELTMGRATYADLTGVRPEVRAYDLNIRRAVYENIASPADVVKIVLWEALKRMGLKGFGGILDTLGRQLGFPSSISPQGLLEKALEALNR